MIGSIYVEIKGDRKQFDADMRTLRTEAKKSGTEVANALNAGISSTAATKGISQLSTSLTQLAKTAQIPRDAFRQTATAIASGLSDVAKQTGMTEKEFARLNERMLRNQAMKTAESSLRSIATSAGLSQRELRSLAIQMGYSSAEAGKMAANVTRTRRSTDGFTTSLKSMATALLPLVTFAAVTRGLQNMATGFLETADRVAKLSQSTGIAVETLSALDHAAKLSGTSLEPVARGLNLLSKNALEASQGTGVARQALDMLGIAVVDTTGKLKNSDAIMLEVADRFAGMQDGAAKTALAMQIFGRSGAEMIPMLNQGSAGIRSMTDEANKLGIAFDLKTAQSAERVNDQMLRLRSSFKGISYQLAADVLPAISDITDGMLGWVRENDDLIKQNLSSVISGISASMEAAWPQIKEVLSLSAKLVGVFLQLAGAGADVLSSIAKLTNKFGELWSAMQPPGGQDDFLLGGTEKADQLRVMNWRLGQETDNLNKKIEEYQSSLKKLDEVREKFAGQDILQHIEKQFASRHARMLADIEVSKKSLSEMRHEINALENDWGDAFDDLWSGMAAGAGEAAEAAKTLTGAAKPDPEIKRMLDEQEKGYARLRDELNKIILTEQEHLDMWYAQEFALASAVGGNEDYLRVLKLVYAQRKAMIDLPKDEYVDSWQKRPEEMAAAADRANKILEGLSESARKSVESIQDLNAEFKIMGSDAMGEFGQVAQAFSDLSNVFDENAEKLRLIAELYQEIEINAAAGHLSETEAAAARSSLREKELATAENYTMAQLKGYRQLFGTTKQMMKENSKEREALHRLELAFAIAEQAVLLKKAVAAAVVAVATQGSGDPYSAFARVAAMAAIMAGLLSQVGGSFSGGGGGGGYSGGMSPTTGTVMGDPDASSESMQRSQELVEKLNDLQYVELTGIHEQMKQLNKNITGLVTGLVRAFGSFGEANFPGLGIGEDTGLADKLGESFAIQYGVIDSISLLNNLTGGALDSINFVGKFVEDLLGGVAKWIIGGEKTKFYGAGLQIGEIAFQELASGIDAGVTAYAVLVHEKSGALGGLFGGGVSYSEQHQAVGGDVIKMVNDLYDGIREQTYMFAESFGVPVELLGDYVIELQRLDLTGLSGEELQKRVTEWWNTLMDTIINDLFGYEAPEMGLENLIGKYQQIDEGLYETAVRLVSSVALVKGVIEMAGGSFEATGMAAVEMSQGILEAAGGIEEFTAGANAILDKMLSPLDKLEMQWTSFNTKWDALGFDAKLPKTSSEFLELLNSIKDTDEGADELRGSLVAAAPALADFYKEIEKITGISGQSVGDALWSTITQNQGGAEFIQGLEDKLREGVARAMVDAFAQSLYDAFLSPINAAITQVMTSLITSGVVTGASIQAATTEIMKALNLSISILKDPAILGLVAEIQAAVGTIAPASITAPSRQSYTSAPSQPAVQDRSVEILSKKLALELQIAELMNDQNAVQEITNQQRAIELQALRDLNPGLAILQEQLFGLQDAARDTAEQLDFEAWQRGLMGITDLDHAMEQFGFTAEQLPGFVEWAANASLDEMKELSRTLGIPLENLKGIFVEAAGAVEEVNASFRNFVDQWTGADSSTVGQLGLSDAELVAVGDYMATLKEGTPEYIEAMAALSGMGISVDDLGNAALSARSAMEAFRNTLSSIQEQALRLTSADFQAKREQEERDSMYAVAEIIKDAVGLGSMDNDDFMSGLMEALATNAEVTAQIIADATGSTPEAVAAFFTPMMDIFGRILNDGEKNTAATQKIAQSNQQMVNYMRNQYGEEQEASITDLLNTMNGLNETLTESQKIEIRKLHENLQAADIKVPGYYTPGNEHWQLAPTYDVGGGYRPIDDMPGLDAFSGGESGLKDYFAGVFSGLLDQSGYGQWAIGGIRPQGQDDEFITTDKFDLWFDKLIERWSSNPLSTQGGGYLEQTVGLTPEDMYRLGELMQQIKDVGSFINSDGSFNKENFGQMYDVIRDQRPEDLFALYGEETAKYLQDMIGLWERFGEEGSDTINELINQFADWQKRLRNEDILDAVDFGAEGKGMAGWVDWAKVTDVNSFLDVAETFGFSMEEMMAVIDAANARLQAFESFQDKLNDVSIMDQFDFGEMGKTGWVDWAKTVGIDEFETVRKQLGYSFEDFVSILDAANTEIESGGKRLSLNLLARHAELEKNDEASRLVLLAQREIELAAMDESLRPLQQRVWALEDATAAENQAIQGLKAFSESVRNMINSIRYSALNVALPTMKAQDAALDYGSLRESAFAEDATLAEQQKFLAFAQQYLQLSQDAYKSSDTYQDIYAQVMADLEQLDANALATVDELQLGVLEEMQKMDLEWYREQIELLTGIRMALEGGPEADASHQWLQSGGKEAADYYEWMEGYRPEGYAAGGIASGPSSGYLATLHGTEAIIPLNGREIPVELRGNGADDRPLHITVQVGNEEFEAYIDRRADGVRVKAERRSGGMYARKMAA